MHIQIPDDMAELLTDGARVSICRLTADLAMTAANDWGHQLVEAKRTIAELRVENQRLKDLLANEQGAADKFRDGMIDWQGTAEVRLTMLTELCAIVAYTLWEDLFHQEGETIDELLRAGRKMKAIREAYAFLECGLGTTKALMDARQQALGI